jgi:lipopolysaccharide/colanic/teichoic acid biosynthesis glycosyltransferase
MMNSMTGATTQTAVRPTIQLDSLVCSPASDVVKRMLDLMLTTLALVALTPLFVIVACLIKLHDGGPIFFCQRRIGRHGIPFWCYKFRSMVPNAEALRADLMPQNVHGENGITFKLKHDPRITPIGRFLRKASIDELPQLFNIIRGEMSLVGPRPPLPAEVAKYNEQHLQRLSVLPGLTCLWQVSGRAELPFEEQVRLDLEYISRRSLALDVSLLIRTIPAVISGRGAC